MHRLLGCLFALSVVAAVPARADDKSPGKFPWLDPTGITGALVIHGGGELPDEVQKEFLEFAGGEKARIVVIPTASERADDWVEDEAGQQRLLEPWKSGGAADVQVLHTRSREEANREAFVAPLKQATAVWFGGGLQQRLADAYLGTGIEREILAVLARGGVIGGTSAGAAIQSKIMIAGGQKEPQMSAGLDLFPGAIIDQHFLARGRRDRLVAAITMHPDCVGFGIDEGTALVVRGRKLRVLGESTVTVILAACEERPLREFQLKAGESHDLTMLRRAGIERSLADFPPRVLPPPKVECGALVIVGGGGMPASVVERFIELAGGPEAPIVVLPIAAGDELSDRSSGETRLFERAGAKHVRSLRARTREEVESDEFAAALKEAKGVWFGGGRQWRFVDAYMATKAEELFRDVLRRGGVIGGSSAGASIQAQVMVRGSPLGNTDMLADGYERGLGFLPGAAVDQHFSQRSRQSDMLLVMQRYPKLLGIGIDEGTALVVQGQTGEVLGRGNVHFYDGRGRKDSDEPTITIAKLSERYDLVERKTLP
jgi:cyanophycinase